MKLGISTNKTLISIDYYRTMGFWPWFLDTELMTEVNWWTVPLYDVVLVARPITVEGWRNCQIVKELGKTLWMDYDDNMFALPEGFGVDRKAVADYTRKSLELADLCICSTPEVEKAYRDFAHTVVRRNLHNDFLFGFAPKFSENDTVGFRGTDRVHNWNIRKFSYIFRGEAGRDWIFWGIKEFYGKHIRELPFMDYMVSLRNRAPAVIVKPLADIPHNRAKSNCTWIEATYAGAVCLAPDWEEWQEPGIVRYESVRHCDVLIDELLRDEDSRLEMWKKSVETIKRKYLTSGMVFRPEEYGLSPGLCSPGEVS